MVCSTAFSHVSSNQLCRMKEDLGDLLYIQSCVLFDIYIYIWFGGVYGKLVDIVNQYPNRTAFQSKYIPIKWLIRRNERGPQVLQPKVLAIHSETVRWVMEAEIVLKICERLSEREIDGITSHAIWQLSYIHTIYHRYIYLPTPYIHPTEQFQNK